MASSRHRTPSGATSRRKVTTTVFGGCVDISRHQLIIATYPGWVGVDRATWGRPGRTATPRPRGDALGPRCGGHSMPFLPAEEEAGHGSAWSRFLLSR